MPECRFRIYESTPPRVKIAYMFLTTALALSLSFAAEATNKDFPDKPYTLKTQGTTTQVKTGAKGEYALQIIPAKGFKVSREAPMKIKLKSSGLTLEKSKLGQKDVSEKKGESFRSASMLRRRVANPSMRKRFSLSAMRTFVRERSKN